MKKTTYFWGIIGSTMLFLTACGTSTSQHVQQPQQTTTKTFKSDDVTVKVNGMENGDRFKAFYQNYSQGKQDQVRVIIYTDEGDPIYTSVVMQGDQLRVTYDNSEDKFGSSKKGKQTFTCSSILASKEEKDTTYQLLGCHGHDETLSDTVYLLRLP